MMIKYDKMYTVKPKIFEGENFQGFLLSLKKFIFSFSCAPLENINICEQQLGTMDCFVVTSEANINS